MRISKKAFHELISKYGIPTAYSVHDFSSFAFVSRLQVEILFSSEVTIKSKDKKFYANSVVVFKCMNRDEQITLSACNKFIVTLKQWVQDYIGKTGIDANATL